MNNTENDSNQRQEIQSSLNSIVESSDKWLERLRRREFRVRLAGSFLTGSLVLVAVGAAILGFFLTQGEDIDAFFEQQSLAFQFLLAGAAAIAGVISGIATYFLLKRKHDARMKDLSSLITEMKRKTNEQQSNANVGGGEGITKEALSLAEKIVTLLPELVRKRKHDSILFGAVAFIVTNVVVSNFVVAIIVGVLVWLYVRHRTKKSYEHEMSKYEEQKRVFEQRKKDFIDTL
jgi:predicted histidine transporter YuiF (NhaC family)